MIKRCPNCNGSNLKLLFTLPNQQGSRYWTCVQCGWEKSIPWWKTKKYQKYERKLHPESERRPIDAAVKFETGKNGKEYLKIKKIKRK